MLYMKLKCIAMQFKHYKNFVYLGLKFYDLWTAISAYQLEEVFSNLLPRFPPELNQLHIFREVIDNSEDVPVALFCFL